VFFGLKRRHFAEISASEEAIGRPVRITLHEREHFAKKYPVTLGLMKSHPHRCVGSSRNTVSASFADEYLSFGNHGLPFDFDGASLGSGRFMN
jgi:hypothetical protein